MNIISNWKTYLKFLSRNKGYTAIDLFGLSVSLMFVLLIGVYTWQEFSTDRFHEKKDRIYIVGTNSVENGYSMAPRLEARYPEIEKTCRIVDVGYGSQLGVKGDNRSVNANLLCADSTFFDFFSFRLLQGDPKQVLVASSNAVVSQSFARKLYGTEDVVGRSLAVDTFRYVISGVMENLHTTSLPKADVILSIKEAPNYNWSLSFGNGLANMAGAVTFVLTHKETDFRQRADDVLAWYKTFFWPYEQGTAKDMRIEKLTDFYFSGWNSYMLHGGDKRFVLILMSVGIVILLFAMLNYINLTVAQAGFRAKEMATRRLLGSSRSELFWRLMSESVLMCTMAMLLAIFFSFYFAPLANDLLRTQLDLSVLASPITIGVIILFIVLLGCISGWLPASVISKVQPIDVVLFFFNILNVDRQASEVADGHISGSRIDAARIRAFDRERFGTRSALNIPVLDGYVRLIVLRLRVSRISFDDTRDIRGRSHRTRQRKADRRREHCFFHDETSLL